MKWKSYAEWDRAVYTNAFDKPISEDTHSSPRAAECVCRRLEAEGFGGDRKYFPIRTWTEMVED
jgi:hypothetical protein